MKKFIALGMSLALMVSAFVGCETTKTPSETTGQTQTASGEKLKFRFMGVIWEPHPESSIIFDELMKRTNTEITFEWHPQANYADKIGVTLASKDIPEVLSGGTVPNLYNQGAIIALDDYLETYGKDMLAALKDSDMPFMRQAFDGKIYHFPNILDFPPAYAMQIRKDWLDNVGIDKLPETWDEWLTAWRAFRDQDANKDGKVDNEIPLVSDPYSLMPAFGINVSNNIGFCIDKNGNYTHAYELPEFKDYLIEMQKLYKEGILDKEFSTRGNFNAQTSGGPEAEKVFHANLAGSTMIWAANTRTTTDLLRENIPEALLTYTKPLTGPKGHSGIPARARVSGNTVLTIAGESKAAEIVSFFNNLYKPEFADLFSYGIEGTTYEKVDGKPVYISPYGDSFKELRTAGLNFTPFPHMFEEEAYLQVTLGGKTPEEAEGTFKLLYEALYSPEGKWFPSVPTLGTKAYSEKQAQVLPDTRRILAECITGVMSVDKFYEEYGKLKANGFQDILDDAAEAWKLVNKK